MATQKQDEEQRTRVVLVTGALVTLVAFALSFAAALQERERVAQLTAANVSAALQTGLATPIESVHAVAAFLMAVDDGGTSHEQFRAMARPFLARHPALVALEWLPRVPGPLRSRFEAVVRAEQPGYELREPTRSGSMVRAVTRDVHMPLVYSEPLNAAVHGLDIAFDPTRFEPVRRAFATQQATLSDPYELVEDPAGVYSVAAYVPVPRAHWRAGLEPELSSGIVLGLYRLTSLFQTALRGVDMRDLALEIQDPAAPQRLRSLYRHGRLDGVKFDSEVRFVDRTYRVVVARTAGGVGFWPWLVLSVGVLSTLLARAYVRSAARARRLERRVAQLGQYTIEYELAHGGMGTVYRARHALLRRPTAIKIARTGNDVEFAREALITCTLNHPNTVQLYDFGKGEDGTAYLAMEFIEGYNLAQLVEISGPTPPGRVVRILIQAAGSLAEAHDRGLLHRDVKPRNIMLTQRGGVTDFVKVLDFGLSSRLLSGPDQPRATFEGTPGFAAPEVVTGGRAGLRSDVFSLGCVAYFLLAARLPFAAATSVPDTLARSLAERPEALPEGTPAPLAELVLACLAKTPEHRPESMHALERLLRAALAACPAWTQQDAEDWWAAHPPPEPARSGRTAAFSIALANLQSSGLSPAQQLGRDSQPESPAGRVAYPGSR